MSQITETPHYPFCEECKSTYSISPGYIELSRALNKLVTAAERVMEDLDSESRHEVKLGTRERLNASYQTLRNALPVKKGK